MTKYIVRYATRNAKGQEHHKSFIINAQTEEIARAKGQQKLQSRKSFNPHSDYIYRVQLHPHSMSRDQLEKEMTFNIVNDIKGAKSKWENVPWGQLDRDELAEVVTSYITFNYTMR